MDLLHASIDGGDGREDIRPIEALVFRPGGGHQEGLGGRALQVGEAPDVMPPYTSRHDGKAAHWNNAARRGSLTGGREEDILRSVVNS